MLSPLRNRFGIPGVISVIALVFAMLGGAYAASDDGASSSKASASAGKQGPPGPRGKRGKPGPAGPAGPTGPAGAKGDTGAAGANGKDGAPGKDGTNGTNGTSATTATFAGVKGSCTEGGIEVKSATPAVLVCNGVKGTNGTNGTDGSPWTVGGVLPAGETETGAWAINIGASGEAFGDISFPIPLAAEIAAADVHKIAAEGVPPATCDDGVAPPPSVANPEADPGHLCVFTREFLLGGTLINIFKPGAAGGGAGTTGAGLFAAGEPNDAGFGTFAVTAPLTP